MWNYYRRSGVRIEDGELWNDSLRPAQRLLVLHFCAVRAAGENGTGGNGEIFGNLIGFWSMEDAGDFNLRIRPAIRRLPALSSDTANQIQVRNGILLPRGRSQVKIQKNPNASD